MGRRTTDVLDTMLRLSMLVTNDMARYEKDSGLTGPRIHLLWTLGLTGPSTQQALATALDVTPRNITGLVDGVVTTGHVAREPHPTDRRAILVTPTAAGHRTIAELRTGHENLAQQLFGGISPRRLGTFVSVLEETTATFERLMQEEG